MVYVEEYGEFREYSGKEFAIEKVATKQQLDEIAEMVKYIDRSKVATDILGLLEEQSWLSAREIQYVLGCRYLSVIRALNRLLDYGILTYKKYNGGVYSNYQYVKKWKLNI